MVALDLTRQAFTYNLKGEPVPMFEGIQRKAATSPNAVDMRLYNALSILVRTYGSGGAMYLQVLGADFDGDTYTPIDDIVNAGQVIPGGVSRFEVMVGARWAKVQIIGVTTSDGVQVTATPYVAGGVPGFNTYGTDNTFGLQSDSADITGAGSQTMNSRLRGIVQLLAAAALIPGRGSMTNISGTIATGNVSQQIAAANLTRNTLVVQNPSNQTESLWLQYNGAAVTSQPSIEIPPGQMYEPLFLPVNTVDLIAVTVGHPYYAQEG